MKHQRLFLENEITGHKYDNQLVYWHDFFTKEELMTRKIRTIVESELNKKNFNIYGWRQVPVNPKVLGEKAELTRPEIAQVLFKSNDKLINNKALERSLYETRRKIEKEALKNQLNNFYICSFSSKSIIYKGMFLAEALSDFYLDLKTKDLFQDMLSFIKDFQLILHLVGI